MRLQACTLASDFGDPPRLGIMDADTRQVVAAVYDEETRRRFIASADMLAALKAAVADFEADYDWPTIDAMRAAIAKAEGR